MKDPREVPRDLSIVSAFKSLTDHRGTAKVCKFMVYARTSLCLIWRLKKALLILTTRCTVSLRPQESQMFQLVICCTSRPPTFF